MHTVILAHGIINRPEMTNWQDRLARLMSGIPDVRVVVYKYGYVVPSAAHSPHLWGWTSGTVSATLGA